MKKNVPPGTRLRRYSGTIGYARLLRGAEGAALFRPTLAGVASGLYPAGWIDGNDAPAQTGERL